MNMFTPAEISKNYCAATKNKANLSFMRTLCLAILAGMIIALGGALSATVTHSIENVSSARIISGLFFAFGLPMVMLSGAELFTGNCLMCIGVLNRETPLAKMVRNLVIVYFGNFIGGVIVAASCAYTGVYNYSAGGLAVATIRTAVAKCSLDFGPAVVMGIFCNVLVCMGVVCGLSAKDTAGRILGAYIPVAVFVCLGFEHCVANMYFIPAGFFAMMNGSYAELAAAAGVDASMLTIGNFLIRNLLPVTIGNILGGVGLGALLWGCHQRPAPAKAA